MRRQLLSEGAGPEQYSLDVPVVGLAERDREAEEAEELDT